MYQNSSQLSNRLLPNQVLDSCASTNDLAKELAESGCPHGAWISARMQTAGRGRLGRSWVSPVGNLYLSIVVRPQAKAHLMSWVPLTTAVAIAQYLIEVDPSLPLQIKWPNDLWLDDRKLGGILCEAIGRTSSGSTAIIIGLGLNCAFSPMIPNDLTEKKADESAASLSLQADAIRLPLTQAIVKAVDDLFEKGPEKISTLYSQRAVLTPGKVISWKSEGTVKQGKVLGLGPSGELIVIENNGDQRSLYAEDVKILLGE